MDIFHTGLPHRNRRYVPEPSTEASRAMTTTHPAKRSGFELEVRTFKGGESGKTYVVFRTAGGSYHAFVETEAKAAARDCGGDGQNTRQYWDSIWNTR
jgi:hypothetical protein